ncbi:synergin gamma isoform X4 [Gopherus flavomarginatus]|uniref:synergin gamma isoform X4 n=1 Tax=Gopherus flavomarginatus TaxID=286002 RepID=UPI0021CC2A7B|nr:synergin gamma isoform X4 [Gopherus flavomarginatus]
MALRPGPGAGGGAGAAGGGGVAGVAGAGSAGTAGFMFPVAGGIGPPGGMIPIQQQGFPMVSVMQSSMPGMMGMNYGSQMSPGPMTMQGGMPLGAMQATGMSFMGQASFLGMRPAAPQYTPDMQKQFAEEQQKRFEHQQKFLEEERKRRQFEEQKQKLRLLSSVKPKTGEKSRDDALEAIKGNLDGFSRDAKMHPTPASHPKKPDHPMPSHSTVSVSQPSAFLDDEEFSDFIQGSVETPPLVPQSSFQSYRPTTQARQLLSEKALVKPLPSAQIPVSSILHDTIGQVPYFSTSTSSHKTRKTGHSLEDSLLIYDLSASGQEQTKLKTSEIEHKASAASQVHPSVTVNNGNAVGGLVSGTTAAEVYKASQQNIAVEECGVGVFPSQDPIQQMMPPWIYNESLAPDLYKKILETTMTPAGIDTAKLYPILMSSGLPRETLGQIWALTNRTTPGKLTKEELYTVLAMIAVTQRGVPAVSPDVLNQFPTAPVPTLSGYPISLPATVNQQPMRPSGPPVSMPLNIGQAVIGVNITPPVGGAAAQVSSGFMPSYPINQVVKPEDDDFQDFQDASKSGSLDESFSDFQGEGPGSSKATSSQHRSSVPPLLIPLPGTKTPSSTDKYAVFKGIAVEKPSESAAMFGDYGDKYSAFRELEQPSESKYLGDSFAEFKSAGTDDDFTDFKTADSISPLDPPTKERTFPASFPSLPAQLKQQTQAKTSLNLADLDLFSSTGENKQLSFPAAFSSSKSTSFPAPPPSTSAAAPPPAPSKSSSLADDFGEFNLFGGLSNCVSVGGQDDFADFMAFNNSSGFSEQKMDDKYKAVKQEASPIPPAGSSLSAMKSGQNSAAAAPTKYDIFKQLSLEGSGTGVEELKDSTPSVKSDDDFSDFHSNKFSSMCSNMDKSLVDKVAAFKHAKEDSASVKSLDLPSIGGSSVGKEDSEDALSVQFDMKLADVGGDLKHVMSDSSLDLPTVSGQHPPAADDLKCAPFGNYNSGSAVSSLASYDWSDTEDIHQSRKLSSFVLSSGSGASSATSVLQKKETLFGSSENITMTTVSKVTTFSTEDVLQDVKFAAFANFKDPGPRSSCQSDDEIEGFGEFSSPLSEVKESATVDASPEVDLATDGILPEMAKECMDEFGEFQSEKPKISKFDFLVATSQGKMKSSEEMIKSELATFDLSVQGSHKRSFSLGDREISRSSPSPALEQPFRDRSNTLSEKPALPVIRDKYKDLTGEVEESERYAYEWQRCLESALQPDENSLDFSSCMLRPGIKNAQDLACGVCLLNVDSRSKKEEKPVEEHPRKAFNSETDHFKLAYGGHQYHASCANFWINCVEPKPPGLILPDLL